MPVIRRLTKTYPKNRTALQMMELGEANWKAGQLCINGECGCLFPKKS